MTYYLLYVAYKSKLFSYLCLLSCHKYFKYVQCINVTYNSFVCAMNWLLNVVQHVCLNYLMMIQQIKM